VYCVLFFVYIITLYIIISNLIQPKILLKSTRNSCSLDYVVPKCKTSQFQKSYFVRTVKLWNSLPTSTRCLSSVACFRSALYHHYKSALDSTFDCDNISTWKSVCPKCLFTRLTDNVVNCLFFHLNVFAQCFCIVYCVLLM
jgi:hypothetical protein